MCTAIKLWWILDAHEVIIRGITLVDTWRCQRARCEKVCFLTTLWNTQHENFLSRGCIFTALSYRRKSAQVLYPSALGHVWVGVVGVCQVQRGGGMVQHAKVVKWLTLAHMWVWAKTPPRIQTIPPHHELTTCLIYKKTHIPARGVTIIMVNMMSVSCRKFKNNNPLVCSPSHYAWWCSVVLRS